MATVGRNIMHPKDLSIADFSYTLPENRIAEYPLPERDASKLLIYQQGNILTDTYRHIADHLPSRSLLIFNDTRVVEARLLFQKSSGGIIEIFCLEPHEQYSDINTALTQEGKVLWHCLVGGASKWKHGQVLKKNISNGNQIIELEASYVEKRTGSFIIQLSWSDQQMSFAELLHLAGAIPLPPYIKRKAEDADIKRYQTIYAHFDGSVAAPTAGLHFTDHIFHQLAEKNIQKEFVTLHVGAGTFKPVKAATMAQHEMHGEFIDVSKKTIAQILTKLNDGIIAVGTTSMRTIESLYWLGTRLLRDKKNITWEISQWEAYEKSAENIPAEMALQALMQWMEDNKTGRIVAKTHIIIAPGYQLRIARALITNFHQPQSTLLLLIAALIRSDWRKVYDYALANDFRFLSYGDGCLIYV